MEGELLLMRCKLCGREAVLEYWELCRECLLVVFQEAKRVEEG